jgi:hypothetical protein
VSIATVQRTTRVFYLLEAARVKSSQVYLLEAARVKSSQVYLLETGRVKSSQVYLLETARVAGASQLTLNLAAHLPRERSGLSARRAAGRACVVPRGKQSRLRVSRGQKGQCV